MSRDEFEDALARYGANFATWPDALAKAGQTLAAADPIAAARLEQAERLDAILAATVAPSAVDSAMVGRIVSGISRRQERATALRPTGKLFAWAGAAMAVFLVAGFVLGTVLPQASDDDDALASLMFGQSVGATVGSGGLL